jgi:hypothetical protein
MKKTILLFSFLTFSGAIYGQTSTKILLSGEVRVTASRLIIRDPLFTKRAYERTRETYAPGFGILMQPYQSGIFHLVFQLGYEERGSSVSYYFETSNPPVYLHIYDRFRCIYSNILVRAQNKKGFYFGLGGAVNKPLNGYYRSNGSNIIFPQGTTIMETRQVSDFTYGIVFAAGKNFSEKTEFELNVNYDQTPVIDRSDAKVFIQAASFAVRYYFRRSDQ